jgi:hypothetical protein
LVNRIADAGRTTETWEGAGEPVAGELRSERLALVSAKTLIERRVSEPPTGSPAFRRAPLDEVGIDRTIREPR